MSSSLRGFGLALLLLASALASPARAAVDLRVEVLAVTPTSVVAGSSVTLTYRVANRGTTTAVATASKPYTDRIYLSLDAALDETDVVLGTSHGHTVDLARGRTHAHDQSVVIPAGTPPGGYFVLVQADALQRFAESGEGNNVTATPLAVADSAPPVAVADSAPPVASDIPELARWEAQMATYGRQACDYLAGAGLTLDQRLAHTYYDQVRVMYQIADYTGQSSWDDCALRARSVYRDQYVLPNNGSVPGYWNFSTGLRMDYERTGSQPSKTAVLLLAENAAYAADDTPLEWTQSHDHSREVAYAILSYIDAEALGAGQRARRAALVTQAYGHMDQWFVTLAWHGTSAQFSPFLVALTADSLIRDWEQTRDARLMPALVRAAEYLWADAWVAENEAMRYQLNPDSPEGGGRSATGSPDLNLLIAPMYAFLYRQTGDTTYRDQGDLLFAGGVRGAYLAGGKQFNQNYRGSVDYIRWRTAA